MLVQTDTVKDTMSGIRVRDHFAVMQPQPLLVYTKQQHNDDETDDETSVVYRQQYRKKKIGKFIGYSNT